MTPLLAVLAQIPTVPATQGTAMDFTWLFIKMLLILGIVCVAAVLVLKYVVPQIGFVGRLRPKGFFTIHARQLIEPRKSLYLVGIGKRYLVIGTADHGISALAELTEGEFEQLMKG
jgi:flagellar biogenesis protein FliO